ncbi:MAG TPA: hypothetical protein DEP05_05265 [Betaproteobacteria bacterium]|nr:hypothetical protein [Betaproteobacteria bacterium]
MVGGSGEHRMLHRMTPRVVWPPFCRTWLAWVILAWFMGGGAWAQSAPVVPFASDLAADAVLARQRHLSILILFSLPSCPYCREVIRDYLVPMQRDPAYRSPLPGKIGADHCAGGCAGPVAG